EVGEVGIDRAALDELGEPTDGEVVAADGDHGTSGDGHQRVEPVAVGQLHVELGVGVVPAAFRAAEPPGSSGDQLDQLGVRVGDGGPADLRTVPSFEPDAGVTGDVDVTDVGIVEERL